jgi:hypothetical protein
MRIIIVIIYWNIIIKYIIIIRTIDIQSFTKKFKFIFIFLKQKIIDKIYIKYNIIFIKTENRKYAIKSII